MTDFMHKNDITWFFPETLMIKESCSLIKQEPQLATTSHTQTKVIVCNLRCYILFIISIMHKIYEIDRFLSDVFMINEFYNLIGWELFRP